MPSEDGTLTDFGGVRDSTGKGGDPSARRNRRWLPVLDHQMKFFDQGVDFLEVFPAAFFWLQIQGAAKGEHIAKIADPGGRHGGAFGLEKYRLPDDFDLGFHTCRIHFEGLPKRLANELQLFGERFHR